MKILHVLNTGRYSGAENVVITLINSSKNETDSFAYTSPDGQIAEILKKNEILFFPTSGNRMKITELKKVIKKYRPDIIHTHDYNAGIVAILTMTKTPIVNHLHNNTPWMKTFNLKSIIYGLSTIRYKHIYMVSDSVRNEYIFKFLFKNKSEIVGNPLDIKKIEELAREEDCEFANQFDVVFLGRLADQKRPLMFISIMKEICKSLPTLKAIMVGSGPLESDVKKAISENGLEQNVFMAGFQNNPYSILSKCKVLCMPSAWEGFGLAAIESMCLGLPVVASPVGGLTNIIDEDCGSLCDSIDDFCNEIYELISCPEKYKEKSKNARIRANELVDLQGYKTKIAKGYERCI